jgi:hypothetical protein
MKYSMIILCLLVVFPFLTVQADESEKMGKADAKKIQGVWTLENMDVGIGKSTTAPSVILLRNRHRTKKLLL